MIFGFRYQAGMLAMLMDKAGEGSGGGGGGGSGAGGGQGGAGSGSGGNAGGGNADTAKLIETLTASNKALEERLAKIEAAGKGGGNQDDPDLQEKAKREREAREKQAGDTKAIEAALKFSLGAKEWLKTNAPLLPKDIGGIFEQAEKENYGSAIEKDAAIKSAVVQEFFKVQSNLDLLTPSQKSALEDFLKLTKNGKQEKAQTLYDNIFEPTFEMLKRIKKAEQLGKEGHASATDAEAGYRDKMMKLSKKHYMGEKTDA